MNKLNQEGSYSASVSDEEYVPIQPENPGNDESVEVIGNIMNSLERFTITESKINGVGRKFKSVDRRRNIKKQQTEKLQLPKFHTKGVKAHGADLYEILDVNTKHQEDIEEFQSQMHSRIEVSHDR